MPARGEGRAAAGGRAGAPGDLADIVALLNVHIQAGHARFETAPLRTSDRADWMAAFSADGPYRLFVARGEAGGLLGFACTQAYRAGPAFAETVEVSIYLDAAAQGQGLGARLYERLFASLAGAGVHRALAGVALPNDASLALHRKFGFREVGVFDEYAQKNGVYISSMWLQKSLRDSLP